MCIRDSYSILPTLVEMGLVLGILFVKYDFGFVLITVVSVSYTHLDVYKRQSS